MKLLFYKFMMYLCWFIEDIHDLFSDNYLFYPSFKWENLHLEERLRRK